MSWVLGRRPVATSTTSVSTVDPSERVAVTPLLVRRMSVTVVRKRTSHCSAAAAVKAAEMSPSRWRSSRAS